MPTLIYTPGIRVFIDTEENGILDVSEDLAEFTLIRRTDGVSTFDFAMNNPRRKYDGKFAPNDRIIVLMKRVTWLRVYTGYLNSAPLKTAWPQVVSLTSSDSLKRLQYWYWDQYNAETQTMIANALGEAGTKGNPDGAIINVILTILKEVVGWPESKVHIGRIPDDWFDIARKIAERVDAWAEDADALLAEFMQTLGAQGVAAGQAVGGNVAGVLNAGNYGGESLSGQQLRNAEIVYSVGSSMGMSARDIVIGLATAYQESRLNVLSQAQSDRDSCGIFQQRPSAGWGTVKQCSDPTYASRKFFTALKKIKGRDKMAVWEAAYAVQKCAEAYKTYYQNWVPLANDLMTKLQGNQLGDALSGLQAVTTGGLSLLQGKNGQTVGSSSSDNQTFLATAMQLVKDHPNIPYQQGSRDSAFLSKNPPAYLDCSSFVAAIHLRVKGAIGHCPTVSYGQAGWCKKITAHQAMLTPGALVFLSSNGQPSGVHHVEVSLGDGKRTIGAHHTGVPASIEETGESYWSFGGLMPSISYSGIGQGGGPSGMAAAVGGIGGGAGTFGSGQTWTPSAAASELPGYDPTDPIDKLFGDNPWAPYMTQNTQQSMLANALTGVRALMNDQPLLPYIKNLFSSTMRSFCSAPNGDLIGWFPDYYGLWGTAAKLRVEPIEIQDFNVIWSDDFFVTHQFALAGLYAGLDLSTGSVQTEMRPSYETVGIANIDIPEMMFALFGIEPDNAEDFARWVYKRFGARPDFQQMEGLVGPKAEFFAALFLFMRQWAYQYNADVPVTFMPEAWPGMLMQVPRFDFQAYITTVTHTGRFGEGGGFNTQINIAAPAYMPRKGKADKNHALFGLPQAGKYASYRQMGPPPKEIEPAAVGKPIPAVDNIKLAQIETMP